MTSIVTVNAWYKQARIVDEAAAKRIYAEFMADRIGPTVACAQLREAMQAAREKVTA